MQCFTAFLASLAEFCHVTSMTTISVCCVVMFCFILMLFFQDIFNWDRDNGGVTHIHAQVPQVAMDKIDLQCHISNVTSVIGVNDVHYHLHISSGTVLFRAYWGVSITAFHHVLKGPWPWFSEAFLHGNLFGESGCLGLGELKTFNSETEVSELTETKPENTQLELGPAPRTVYPVVFCCMPKEDKGDYRSSRYSGAILSVIHLKDDTCQIGTHILATYLKHNGINSPAATHLVPIYSTEEGGESLCAVCQEFPVTRVILPCKHACACNRCFERLNCRCPMCRTHIQSYFLTGPEVEREAETPSDQNQLPVTWRQRFNNINHRYAMAMGLQEN